MIKIWNPEYRTEETANVFSTEPAHASDLLSIAEHFAQQKWAAYGKPDAMDLCARVDDGEVQQVCVVAEQTVTFKAVVDKKSV